MVRALALLTAAVIPLVGCDKRPYPTAHVSGRITVNGKPYPKLAVTFHPLDAGKDKNHPNPSSAGTTDADGRYSLTIIGTEHAGSSGAVVGKHEVRIMHQVESGIFDEVPAKTKPSIEIPAKYWSKGAFTIDVPSSGTSKADFDLKIP